MYSDLTNPNLRNWYYQRMLSICEAYKDVLERPNPQANANRLQNFAREVAESIGFSASGGDV
jgi:hypothetical protein